MCDKQMKLDKQILHGLKFWQTAEIIAFGTLCFGSIKA